MKDILKKIKLVFIPFLTIAGIFIPIYTFLNWLLFIELELLSLKQIVVNFVLPFALPWIPILIWLRPKTKVFHLKKKNSDLPFLYQFVAALAITAPTVIAQEYIETATGKMTQLQHIEELNATEKTKYYQLEDFYIDKTNIGVHHAFDVSGKNNKDFNIHLYVAMPIYKSVADAYNSNCVAWYGKEYSKTISNRLNDEAKEFRYKNFINESQDKFDEFDPTQFVYLERLANTDERDGMLEAIKASSKFSPEFQTILMPVNEPFEARNGNKLEWIFGAFAIGAIIFLIMVMIPKLNQVELRKLEKGQPVKDQELKEMLEILIPQEGYFITPILAILNVLVFLAMIIAGLGFISFQGPDLLLWGANYRPETIDGEWWRLLTSTFLHGGIMHLLFNMYGLLFVGSFLEPVLGRVKYLFLYLLTGLLASCASIWWYEATISVGASGAIFGMYGVFLALMATKVFPPAISKSLLMSTIAFVGFNLLMGLTGGIDNAAHIGGLISGLLAGFALSPLLPKHEKIVAEIEEREEISSNA